MCGAVRSVFPRKSRPALYSILTRSLPAQYPGGRQACPARPDGPSSRGMPGAWSPLSVVAVMSEYRSMRCFCASEKEGSDGARRLVCSRIHQWRQLTHECDARCAMRYCVLSGKHGVRCDASMHPSSPSLSAPPVSLSRSAMPCTSGNTHRTGHEQLGSHLHAFAGKRVEGGRLPAPDLCEGGVADAPVGEDTGGQLSICVRLQWMHGAHDRWQSPWARLWLRA